MDFHFGQIYVKKSQNLDNRSGGLEISRKSNQNAAEGWTWGAPLCNVFATFFEILRPPERLSEFWALKLENIYDRLGYEMMFLLTFFKIFHIIIYDSQNEWNEMNEEWTNEYMIDHVSR